MHDAIQQMLHTWSTGGWVMMCLAMVGLVSYSTAVHLMVQLYHRGLTKTSDDDVRRWVAEPKLAPANLQELIRYTQDEVQSLRDIEGRFREVETAKISDVDRRMAFLNILVVSAPLFGLLGTVLGMLLTFKAIGIGGSSTSEFIAKGISEALTATQTGMMVAIPGLMLAFVVKRWRNELVAFLARLEGITLRYFRPQFHGMTRIITRPAPLKAEREKSDAASPFPDRIASKPLPQSTST